MPPAMPPLPPGLDPALAQFARMENVGNPRSWHQATFWLGLTALAQRSGAPGWRDAILEHGRAAQWQVGDRPYNADDHLIGRTYLWASQHGAGRAAIQPLRDAFDRILADPPRAHLALYLGPEGMRGYPKAECLKRWCWADALFMAPATWIGLSNATGDRRYTDYALSEFWAASNFLYDPAERLYFRDSSFFDKRDEQGRKIFWSRGNGWVLAGLAQMLDALPAQHPERARLENHFREFAGRMAQLQKPDGYWPSSLLDAADATPESSGTALFTYALAWGVGHRVLPRAQFEPAARRGWQALQAATQPDGSLGWVQPAGDRPGKAVASGTQIYASGAYLLAATAIADFDRNR
jgi:rhamnogalacturonyl hydrolase YesR